MNIAIAEVEAAEEENSYSEATELCKVIEQLSEKMHNPEIKEKYSSKWNLFESKIKSEQEEKTNLLNSLVVDLEEKEKLQDIGAAKALCEDILKLTSEMDEKVLSKKIKGKLESINRLIKLQSGKKKELEQAMSIVEAKEHQGDYLVAAIMCDQIIILAEDLEKSDLVDQFTSRKEDLERRYSEGYERTVQEIDEKSIEAATKEQSGDYTGALILCEKIKHLAMDIDRPDLAKKFARKIRKLRIQSNKSISEQEALQEDLANLIKLEKSKETERDLLKAVEFCVDIIEIASELNDQPQIKKYTTLQDKLLLQHQKQVEKDEKAIADLLLEVEREWKQRNFLAAIDTCDKAISMAKTAKFPSQVKILTKKQSYLQKDHQNYLKQQKKYDKQASKLISSLENFEKEEKYSKAISICSEIITLASQMNNSDIEKEYMDRKVTLESKVADRKESASEMKKLIQQIDIDARNQNYQAAISACEKVQTQARLLNIPNIADKFTQRKSKLARFLQRQQREQEFLRKDVEEGMATIQMAEASEDLQAIIHECETIQQTALKLQDSDLFEKYEALSVACQEKIASERKTHEETLEAALKQVNLLQAQKDYEGAISACETIVEISPKVDRSELVKTYNRKKAKFVKLSQQSIFDEKSLQEELAETVASVKQMEQGEDYQGAIELCDLICEMADELQNTDVILEYLQRKTDLQEKAIESLRLQNIKLLELINAVEEMEKGKNYGEAIKNCEQIINLAPEVQHPEYIPQYQNKIKRLKRLQKKHFSRRENLKSVLASLQEKIDGKEESKDFQGAIDLCDEAGPIAVEMGDNYIQAQLLSRKETLQEKLKNKHKHTAQIKVLIRKVSQKQKARDF